MEKRGGQAGPALGELTLQTAACSEPPAKRQNMTFGLPINMCANGVRTLAAWYRRPNLSGASADVYACSVKCR
jgi:hypothetical protein